MHVMYAMYKVIYILDDVVVRKRRYLTGAIGNDLPHAAGDLHLLLG